MVRSRTRDRSDPLLSDLASRNSDLAVWSGSHSQHSCAYEFLDRGMRRLCMSISSEQANSFLGSTSEKPTFDIVRDLIKKMSNDFFLRGGKAIDLINSEHNLTSCALSAHSSIVCGSNAFLCGLEEVASDGIFTCIVRRGPRKTEYRVRVTPTPWSNAHVAITKN